MIRNRENRVRLTVLFILTGLGVLLFFLQMRDLNGTVESSIKTYQGVQDDLAYAMFHSSFRADSENQESIVNYIKNNYKTSSSSFCILTKNDQIIYLKDDNTTAAIGKEKFQDLFNSNSVFIKDGEKYMLSVSKADNSDYAFMIATRQTYLMKILGLNETILHVVSYFTFYGVILLIMIAFSLHKIFSLQKTIQEKEILVGEGRLLIEKYETDRRNNYVSSEKEDTYSFYTRNIVEEVIERMNREEKQHCIQVNLYVKKIKMEHFVLITAILGRIRSKNSISCYWEDNLFKVLLLQPEKEEVERFVNLFIEKYRAESEENVDELQILATPLVSGEEGGRR